MFNAKEEHLSASRSKSLIQLGGIGPSSTKVWRLGRDLASVREQQPNGQDHSEQDGFFLAAVDRKIPISREGAD